MIFLFVLCTQTFGEPIASELINNGTVLCFHGKYDEAIASYDKAIDLEPNNARAWSKKALASSYLGVGNEEDVIRCANKVVELSPSDADIWIDVGIALCTEAEDEKAIDILNKAIDLEPNNARAWSKKALAYNYNNREEAIKCINKAIELNSSDADIQIDKGYLLYRLGFVNSVNSVNSDYLGAIEAFKKAIELNSSKSYLWTVIGGLFVSLGDYEKAQSHMITPSIQTQIMRVIGLQKVTC